MGAAPTGRRDAAPCVTHQRGFGRRCPSGLGLPPCGSYRKSPRTRAKTRLSQWQRQISLRPETDLGQEILDKLEEQTGEKPMEVMDDGTRRLLPQRYG